MIKCKKLFIPSLFYYEITSFFIYMWPPQSTDTIPLPFFRWISSVKISACMTATLYSINFFFYESDSVLTSGLSPTTIRYGILYFKDDVVFILAIDRELGLYRFYPHRVLYTIFSLRSLI